MLILQAKSKELELLCSLKNVEFDPIEQEQSVGKLMWVLWILTKAFYYNTMEITGTLWHYLVWFEKYFPFYSNLFPLKNARDWNKKESLFFRILTNKLLLEIPLWLVSIKYQNIKSNFSSHTYMFLCNLLRQRLESEAKTERQEIENVLDVMPVTKKFLFSVMECAELLCNVTIESSGNKTAPERSISHCSFVPDHGQQSQQCKYS